MTDKWDGLFDEDDLPQLFKSIEQAKRLGKERYGAVVFEGVEAWLENPDFSHLLTGLVIGNIAFDAEPGCSVMLNDRHRLVVKIEEAE